MPLIITPISMPSTKKLLNSLVSSKSLKIMAAAAVGTGALYQLAKLYEDRHNFIQLWGRIKLQGFNYASFISKCEALKAKLRALDFTQTTPGPLYDVLEGMSDIEALASLEILVQEKREEKKVPSPRSFEGELKVELDDAERVEEAICSKNPMRALGILCDMDDSVIRREVEKTLQGHVSLLPKNSSKFMWSFNASGLFQYLLLGSALSTSLLTRVWGKSPPFLQLVSSLLKDYLPITMRMGMESIYAEYTIKRIGLRITPVMKPITTMLSEINQKYQTSFDIFHILFFLYFMYRRYQEPPSIQTSLIPSNILSSDTVPYCDSLNYRAHTGEYNQLELNHSRLQELDDALSKGGGAILTGGRRVGSSALIKCFAQKVSLGELDEQQSYSIFSLSLDELRPREVTLQNLLNPESANSAKGKIGQMLSFITTKVKSPVIVIDHLHQFALSEDLNGGSWLLSVLRQLVTSLNDIDPSCRIKLIITSPPLEDEASRKLANFLQEVFVGQRALAEVALRPANREETAKALQKQFGGITENLPFLNPLKASGDLSSSSTSTLQSSYEWWAKVYDWVAFCYPNDIMPGKAIEVVGDILKELRLKAERKAQEGSSESKFQVNYEGLKKKVKELQALEQQSLESGYYLRSCLDQDTDPGVIKLSLTLLIIEFILIPRKRRDIEHLRSSLAEEHLIFTEQYLKSYLQRKKQILLTVIDSPTRRDLTDLRDERMPKIYPGKESLIGCLFSPYIEVRASFDFINIRGPQGVEQKHYPQAYILQKEDELLLPVVRDFAKSLLLAIGFRESLYEIDFSNYGSWDEFMRLKGSELFGVLREAPSTHIIVKNMRNLEDEDKQHFLAFFSDTSSQCTKELLPLKYATFYFITDDDGSFAFFKDLLHHTPVTSFKDEALDEEKKKQYLARNLAALKTHLAESEARIEFCYEEDVIDVLFAEAQRREIGLSSYLDFLSLFFKETCRNCSAGGEEREESIVLHSKRLYWRLQEGNIRVDLCDK